VQLSKSRGNIYLVVKKAFLQERIQALQNTEEEARISYSHGQ
jgi:hypothetical protein